MDSGCTDFPLFICSIIIADPGAAEKPRSDPAMSVVGAPATPAESKPAMSADRRSLDWLALREEREDGLRQKCWAWGSGGAALLSAVGSLQHHLRCFPGAVGGGSRSPMCIPALCKPSIPHAYPRSTQP